MGYRVKEIREQKNMTQEELEARSGISRQTISAIENGKANNVTVATLRALANGLETSIGDLFFENAV
jgi:putative transcriptional regulator